MSLEKKLSQLFITGYYGDRPDNDLLKWACSYLGGVIFFRENIKSAEYVAEYINGFQKLADIGMFIAVDQEGGPVERIKDLTKVPSPMALAAIADVEAVRSATEIIAEELKLLGFNLNFAPCLDVNKVPDNPVIGIRSFGDNPLLVAECGLNVINVFQKKGIIPVAKHFPGHGATNVDSHLDLPLINIDFEELKNVHLYPFARAIDNNVEMIMLSHVNFENLSGVNLPASLSERIINDLLINEMSYKGVIITDDLNMSAISRMYSIEKASEMALNAGVDVLLYRNYKDALRAYSYLISKIKEGEISEKRIDLSLKKILKLKQQYSLIDPPYPQNTQGIIPYLKRSGNAEKASTLFDRSITIFKMPDHPLNIDDKKSVLLLSVDRLALAHFNSNIKFSLKDIFYSFDEVIIPLEPDIELCNDLISRLDNYELVIIISYNAYFYSNQAELIRNIIDQKEVYILAAGSPYDVTLFKGASLIALSYGYEVNALISFANFLKEKITGNSNIPVKLPL